MAKKKDKAEDKVKNKAKGKDKQKDKGKTKDKVKNKPKDTLKAKEKLPETASAVEKTKKAGRSKKAEKPDIAMNAASAKVKKKKTAPPESISKPTSKAKTTRLSEPRSDVLSPVAARPQTEVPADTDLLLTTGHVYRLSVAELQAALKAENISASQWEILSFLSADTPLTQQVLARSLYVSEGNITQMLTKMETLGWIKRKREWRTNYVTLTAAGAALQAHVRSVYDDVNERFFAPLTDDERLFLARLMTRLLPEATDEN